MFINDNVKYRDILIFALIGIIGYKLIDNYNYFFNIVDKGVSILNPFIYALVFAYILNPIVSLFQKRFKLKRQISIVLTYLMLLALIFIALFFTIPSIIESIINITVDIPQYVDTAQNWINFMLEDNKINALLSDAGMISNLHDITTYIGNVTMSVLQNGAGSLVSFTSNLVNVLFGFIISIYVLIERDNLLKRTKIIMYMIFKPKKSKAIIEFVKTYNYMIGTYVGIKALDSLIIGTLALIGFVILGVPYAPLLAGIVAITNMIPYFGPLVGIVISGIVTVFTSFTLAIAVVIMLFALQQFDAWYLEAKLVGKKVGVSPLAIIFGVTVGGGILGPIGMLLGSPTMATAKIYYDKIFQRYKQNNLKLIKDEKLDC